MHSEKLHDPEDEFSEDLDDYYELEELCTTTERTDQSYTVLSIDEIFEQMEEVIREIKTFAKLSTTTIRILFNHVKWNKDKLVERLYEDERKLFNDALLLNPRETPKLQTENEGRQCVICYTDTEHVQMTKLECGHQYCDNCWREYLTTRIMQEWCGQSIACAGYNCDTPVDDDIVMELVAPDVQVRYQVLIANSYVQCNKQLTWCPDQNCNNVVKLEEAGCRPVICCGRPFCFACNEMWHEPIDCGLFKEWLNNYSVKNCDEIDNKTSQWIEANTKKCPKCKVNVEMIGGCNLVTCSKICNHEFIWDFLEDDDFDIPKYDEMFGKTRKSSEGHVPSSNCDNSNVLHYTKHLESLKLEQTLPSKIKVKTDEMFAVYKIQYTKSDFLLDAADVLCQCRETLMVTYVFSFYLQKGDHHSLLLEEILGDLDVATENLSKYLENLSTSDNSNELKQILDASTDCENRRKILLKYIHSGYVAGCWLFGNIVEEDDKCSICVEEKKKLDHMRSRNSERDADRVKVEGPMLERRPGRRWISKVRMKIIEMEKKIKKSIEEEGNLHVKLE